MDAPFPRWSDDAAGRSEAERLRYRSNLLGSDLRLTNYGGGNTSAKLEERDPVTGAPVAVLWVKGSGGDLGTLDLDGFARLDLARVRALRERYAGPEREDELVPLLEHCAFGPPRRPASIDTPLHAFVPQAHVDHLHPDAVIALAASRDGAALVEECYGGRVGWLDWRRPGFALAFELEALLAERPGLEGIVLARHGLLAWGDGAKACFERSVALVEQASAFAAKRARRPAFGGERVAALATERRRALAAKLLPVLRGKLAHEGARSLGRLDDSDAALAFVGARDARALAERGTSCPDHFVRTRIRPLWLDFDPARDDADALGARIDPALARYRADYRAYYERCRRPDSPALRDASPALALVPGVGVLGFGRDAAGARLACEFWRNAIEVMRGAHALSEYVGLPEQAAFDVEYWALEEAKLRRLPPERELARRVALVTGAAGGIGRACARRLLADGAAVLLADVDEAALASVHAALVAEFGADPVRARAVDVTSEASVARAFEAASLAFGGVDVVVCSAGLASAAPIEETTLELWRTNLDVLATGYFLVAREAFRVWKPQDLGGSLVFIGSKNALAASANAAAYNTAKSAELALARTLALEGGPHGIRVNTVNPDAVLRGSRIWDSDWRRARAETYGISEGDLEEHYRKRSLLRRSVLPEDVAEAVAFLASDRSAKSTGNVINVDAGSPTAFPR
jgi:rhamnulose-1-phosphate aldolase/alcohol dehydrogenase